jgi:hypothetical protein
LTRLSGPCYSAGHLGMRSCGSSRLDAPREPRGPWDRAVGNAHHSLGPGGTHDQGRTD